MKRNDLIKYGDSIYRVLEISKDKIFVIDCKKKTIPFWILLSNIEGYTLILESNLFEYISLPLHNSD